MGNTIFTFTEKIRTIDDIINNRKYLQYDWSRRVWHSLYCILGLNIVLFYKKKQHSTSEAGGNRRFDQNIRAMILMKIYRKINILWTQNVFNPLMPGSNKKVTHTWTNLLLSAPSLFKYVWPFCHHQALKC